MEGIGIGLRFALDGLDERWKAYLRNNRQTAMEGIGVGL